MWYPFQEHVCWYATLGCGVSLYRRHFVLDGVYLLTLYFWEVAPSKSHNTREVSLGRNAQTRRTGYLARATDTKHGVLSLFVKDKPLSYSVSAECGVSRPRSLWLRSQCVMFVFFSAISSELILRRCTMSVLAVGRWCQKRLIFDAFPIFVRLRPQHPLENR